MARKPTARQLAARRAFARRYGGRKAAGPSRARTTTPMARKTRRRSGGRRFGGFSGGMTKATDGVIGGAAARLGAGYLGPTWGPAVGLYVAGTWRKNDTLTTLAGLGVGANLAGSLQLPGMTGSIGAGGLL